MTALIRSSRDHGTRPRFIEKASTSQYSQNAAQPTAKTVSTALTSRGAAPEAALRRMSGRRRPFANAGGECFAVSSAGDPGRVDVDIGAPGELDLAAAVGPDHVEVGVAGPAAVVHDRA